MKGNVPRVLWFLANHPNSTRDDVCNALTGFSATTLRDILYKTHGRYVVRKSTRPTQFSLSPLGAAALERHLADTGRPDDALLLTRARFERMWFAPDAPMPRDIDGDYMHPLARAGWLAWRHALGLA